MGFQLLFIYLILSSYVQIEGRNCFVNDEVWYVVSALLFQTNKIGRLV